MTTVGRLRVGGGATGNSVSGRKEARKRSKQGNRQKMVNVLRKDRKQAGCEDEATVVTAGTTITRECPSPLAVEKITELRSNLS